MIQFILNHHTVNADLPAGSTVLDYVRYHKRQHGTKIGCREGDCGACTILVGNIENDQLIYRSMTSCLMPLVNAHTKQIVTIEGINMDQLSPVQKAMADTNGTQCGFCTPGFIMSLTGFVVNESSRTYEQAIAAIDGNICRCTGYKSIERAAALITDFAANKPKEQTVNWLVDKGFIPPYFANIKSRLKELQQTNEEKKQNGEPMLIGGGTDLIVQRSLQVKRSAVQPMAEDKALKKISVENNQCIIGASITVSEFSESAPIQKIFPKLKHYMKLVSSTPIRNMATLAGNFVNASPIGDMTVFFLALDTDIFLTNGTNKRQIKLKDFYKGYKQLDKTADEYVTQISFKLQENKKFNFEKVSKRTHLDIASVNSACGLVLTSDGIVEEFHLSAGGVSPIPKYLKEASSFLKGRLLSEQNIHEALAVMNDEISPISDARGSSDYKRLLLRQLVLAHLLTLTGNSEVVRKIIAA
jgi:xanthine dehydrogenase small subunit